MYDGGPIKGSIAEMRDGVNMWWLFGDKCIIMEMLEALAVVSVCI